MKHRDRVSEIFGALVAKGMTGCEAFLKSGRSRRFEIGPMGRVSGTRHETGWAIRATTARASMFTAGTGLPGPDLDWPDPDGHPLLLPIAAPVPSWRPPEDLDDALISETEAMGVLEGIEKALVGELPGSRLIHGLLEEGSSDSSIFSTQGIEFEYRRRAASLRVEAVGPWRGSSSVTLSFAARAPRGLAPIAVAKRLANRIMLMREGAAIARERGDVLVGSPVAAQILFSLMPMLLGPEGEAVARRLRDRQGRVGSMPVTIVDDGRLPGGILESPVDGEGRPTGVLTLVEGGQFRQSLRDWRDLPGRLQTIAGCVRRESWRDLPGPGPSHLFLQDADEVSVGDLLSSISRGYYLLEPLGPGRFDFSADRFQLPVCGFVLQQGRATAPLSKVWLEGGIGAFLRGIEAVARDLSFYPLGALVGAPSLLVRGLGLRATD